MEWKMEQVKPELFKASSLYAVLATKEEFKIGMSLSLDRHGAGTAIIVRFAVTIPEGSMDSKPKFKFFTLRESCRFYLEDGTKIRGYRLNKTVMPFSEHMVTVQRFVTIADENEVWEKLESWVISALAAEELKQIPGIDLSALIRGAFEQGVAEEVDPGYCFEMPTLLGFTQTKAMMEAPIKAPDEEEGDNSGFESDD
jgi:hypothetical protein